MQTRPDLDPRAGLTPKPRKMSTGGNRSWSEEEEAYLIQTRMQKMPYKHIAAHLKKTELACRLHFHQLSHGSHRRRRASTSTNSSTSSTSSKYSLSQLPLPVFDSHGFPNGSPPNAYHQMPGAGYGAPMHHGNGRAPQHKMLLPKPPTITPDSSPDRYSALRIDMPGAHLATPSSVDIDRLDSLYNSHAHHEDIWRHNIGMRRPPTPQDSPNSRAALPLLKASPFPNYPSSLEPSKDYGPVGHVIGSLSPPEHHHYQHRLSYPMAPPLQVSGHHHYDSPSSSSSPPSLPPLMMDRQPQPASSWSTQAGVGVPATAITALLTEDKCPRHSEYCTNGGCYGNH